jgi:hypothetical protein
MPRLLIAALALFILIIIKHDCDTIENSLGQKIFRFEFTKKDGEHFLFQL